MRQNDNTIHIFYSMLILLLGIIIGAMFMYIAQNSTRDQNLNPIQIPVPRDERGFREYQMLPAPHSRGSTQELTEE